MLSLQNIQNFSIIDLIKAGSYSSVYKAEGKNGDLFAIKILEAEAKKPKKSLSIFRSTKPFKEGKILHLLQKISGIPKLFFYGKNPDINSNMIVTELLGKDLGVLFFEMGRFPKEFICFLSVQLLNILEEIHRKNVIHRDLKPDNILMKGDSEVFLTDFGLSKIEKKKGSKKIKRPQFVGNLKFASINSHNGKKISKKDDLESFGYVITNFLLGFLPWEKINSSDLNEKIEKIGKRKEDFLENELEGLPRRISQYFTYVKGLKNGQTVDYGYLKSLFELFAKEDDIMENGKKFIEKLTTEKSTEKSDGKTNEKSNEKTNEKITQKKKLSIRKMADEGQFI